MCGEHPLQQLHGSHTIGMCVRGGNDCDDDDMYVSDRGRESVCVCVCMCVNRMRKGGGNDEKQNNLLLS